MTVHLKINELLAALNKASPGLINVEDLGEDEIIPMHDDFEQLPKNDAASHSIEEVASSPEAANEKAEGWITPEE